jgi:predicted transcriptional regulator
MNCIFSLKKCYADLILDGTKPIEFRNVLPKLEHGDKVYIYETKSKGCGKVVGYFVVDFTRKIPSFKIGTYIYMDLYADMFCDDYTKNMVKKAKEIELDDYDNSFVLYSLFKDDDLDEMKKTHKPVDHEFWTFSQEDMDKYEKDREKQNKFMLDCDKWLSNIGFYNRYDEADWKYEIRIKEVVKFEKPLDLTNFKNSKNEFMQKAPQSFCYTLSEI